MKDNFYGINLWWILEIYNVNLVNNFFGIIIFLKNFFKNCVDDLLILLIIINIIIIFKWNGFFGLYII